MQQNCSQKWHLLVSISQNWRDLEGILRDPAGRRPAIFPWPPWQSALLDLCYILFELEVTLPSVLIAKNWTPLMWTPIQHGWSKSSTLLYICAMSPHVVYSTLDLGIMIADTPIFFMYIIIQCIGFEANWFWKQVLSQSNPLQFNTNSVLIRLPHGPHWPFFSLCTNQPWIIILQIQQDVMQENSNNYKLSFAWFLWFSPCFQN